MRVGGGRLRAFVAAVSTARRKLNDPAKRLVRRKPGAITRTICMKNSSLFRERSVFIMKSLLLSAFALASCFALPAVAQSRADRPLPHRVFAASRFAVDKILA